MKVYGVFQCWDDGEGGDWLVALFSTFEKAIPTAEKQMKDLSRSFPKWEEVEKGCWESVTSEGKFGHCLIQIQEWEVK